MRRIAVLDAPTNLGLRPPTPTSVPGCAKAPGALRDHGLLARLQARDAGCLTPPRYDPGDFRFLCRRSWPQVAPGKRPD